MYGEKGLARSQVALWLGTDSLTVEFAGDTLSRYEVTYSPSVGQLRQVKSPRLFVTRHRYSPQLRLFNLNEVLGETGWLKAIKVRGYATRKPRQPQQPQTLQQTLLAHTGAV